MLNKKQKMPYIFLYMSPLLTQDGNDIKNEWQEIMCLSVSIDDNNKKNWIKKNDKVFSNRSVR